jgi:hypothetical protein
MLLTLLGGADISRVDYVLSSLTLEESLLPVDTKGAPNGNNSSANGSSGVSEASYINHFPSLSGGGANSSR